MNTVSIAALLPFLLGADVLAQVPSDPVAWWPGDGFHHDVAGTNHGSLRNGTGYGLGVVGKAFLLDGVNDRVEIAASPTLDVGAAAGFSVELWINPSDVGNHPIVEWSNGSSHGVHLWLYPGSGQLYANVKDTAGGSHSFSTNAGIVTTNTWQHVALTYAKTTGTARLYLNGVIEKEETLGTFDPQTT